MSRPPWPSHLRPPPIAAASGEKEIENAMDYRGRILFLLLGGGALAGIFFFVVKPRLDEMSAQQNTNMIVIENTNTNTSTPMLTASVEAPSPTPEERVRPHHREPLCLGSPT